MGRCRSAMLIALTGSLILIGASAGGAYAASPTERYWPQWRGPSGQGYCEDMRVPLNWDNTKNVLWKTAVPGLGNSTPIVWGQRIFLTASDANGRERYVLCVRTTDGKILWQQTASKGIDPGKTHPWNGFASPSCTTDGKHVYAFFGTPGLFCYDFEGNLVWKHSFGIFTHVRGWGMGASPFLFENLVIQNCDNDGPAGLPPGRNGAQAAPAALIALDKRTGEVKWQTERNQGMGWSTPLLIPMPDGRVDLVLNGPNGVWGYDPHTGKEVWHCDRHKDDDRAKFGEPMPAFNRDRLFAASGRPGPLQAIRLGGQGDVSKSHLLWEGPRKGSRDVGSPILTEECLYIGDREGILSGYEPKTGRFLFKERVGNQSFSASAVAIQGKLVLLMEDGVALIVQPDKKLKIISKNRLTDDTAFRASPAIADGRLFLRSQSHLYCIGEKK